MEDVSVKFVITQQIDFTFTHDDYIYVSIYITTQSNHSFNFYLVCH